MGFSHGSPIQVGASHSFILPPPPLLPAGSSKLALQGQGLGNWKEVGSSLVLTPGEPKATRRKAAIE